MQIKYNIVGNEVTPVIEEKHSWENQNSKVLKYWNYQIQDVKSVYLYVQEYKREDYYW